MNTTRTTRSNAARSRWIQTTLGAVAASALLVSGCRSDRTQIVVVVDTDFAVPSRLGSLRVIVGDPADPSSRVQAISLKGAAASGCADAPRGGSYCVPLSFLVVPSDGRAANQPVQVTIEGVAGDDALRSPALLRRSARLPFASGQTLRLPMFLASACEGVICPTDYTCGEQARCVPIDDPPGVAAIDPRTGAALDASVARPDATVADARDEDATSARGDAVNDSPTSDSATNDAADGRTNPQDSPCAHNACPDLSAIAAGPDFTCALYTRGAVACWGANDEGQLGRGTTTPRESDQSGGLHAVELVGGLSNASELALGEAHACAAWSAMGSRGVSCWGRNRAGALAVGSPSNAVPVASPVVGLDARGALSSLVAGADSTYVLSGAMVFAWGDNSDGAIGFAAPAVLTAPAAFSNVRRWHNPVARGRGLCWRDPPDTMCVGRNDGQRFGAMSAPAAVVATPTAVEAQYRSDTIAMSRTFACAIAGGNVVCWGENRASGVLGRAPIAGDPTIVLVPRVLTLPSAARAVATGEDFVLASTNDGRLFCWGSNADGACATGTQAPDGTVAPSLTTPVEIVLPAGFVRPVRAITAGNGHACALSNDRLPWCWGRNANAQTGVALSADRRTRAVLVPTPVFAPMLP